MKKIILLPFVCFIFIQCATKNSAETTSINSIIENEKLNVIYRGIENRLKIFVPNTDSIKVSGFGYVSEDKSKVSKIKISKVEENLYSIIPTAGNKIELTITGYIKGYEIIEKREFRILNIGNLYGSIDLEYGCISKSKEELAESKIGILIPQLLFEMPIVTSFNFQINVEKSIFNNGNKFSESAKQRIGKLVKGDIVEVNYIFMKSPLNTISLKTVKKLLITIE